MSAEPTRKHGLGSARADRRGIRLAGLLVLGGTLGLLLVALSRLW